MRISALIAVTLLLFASCDQDDPPPFSPVDHLTELDDLDDVWSIGQLIPRSTGGYFLCGGTTYIDDRPDVMMIFNIAADHSLVWKNTYQIENYTAPSALSICEMEPTRYLVAAEVTTPGTFDHAIAILEMDAEGAISTPMHTFPLVQASSWARVLRAQDGGYYLGYIEDIVLGPSSQDSFVIIKRFNADNEEEWSITLPNHYWQPDMKIATNGDILVAGSTYPQPDNIQDRDMIVVRITPLGHITLVDHFGGPGGSWDVGCGIVEYENGALVTGYLTFNNTPVVFRIGTAGVVGEPVVLNDTLYINKNEIRKLQTGFLVTNLHLIKRGASEQSLNLVKLNDDLAKAWSYNVPLDPMHAWLINTVLDSDGSVSIAFVGNQKIWLLKTKPL